MADLTEKQIYEALGLQGPEGENGQGVAAPADQPSQAEPEEGAKGQDSAVPASDTAKQVGSGNEDRKPGAVSTDENDAGVPSTPDKQPLSEQQRRENAHRRRQQEQQATIDQAVAAALKAERENQNKQLAGFFAHAGLKNPVTGEPITTMEQFTEWQQQHTVAQLQRDLKAGNLTPEMIRQMMDSHPVIQQAQQLLDQQRSAAKAQQEAEDKARIDAELARIHEKDPNINTVQDLLNMPTAEAFKTYVKKGYSFEDAYYLANRERLEQQQAEAAKQQAMNSARSKGHLSPVGNVRSDGAIPVPAQDMAWFRALNPNATDAEIQAFYNKYYKE